MNYLYLINYSYSVRPELQAGVPTAANVRIYRSHGGIPDGNRQIGATDREPHFHLSPVATSRSQPQLLSHPSLVRDTHVVTAGGSNWDCLAS